MTYRTLAWTCAILALLLGVLSGHHWQLRNDVERTRIEAYERGLLDGAKATAAREAREAGGATLETCLSHNRALRFRLEWTEQREELDW